MNYQRSILIFVIFLLIAAVDVFAQDVEMIRLSDKVIVLNVLGLDCRTNIVVISSQKGLVVIDTEISPHVMKILKEAAEKYFKRQDWIYAINTHGHIHHIYGNVLFKDVNIIGQESLIQRFPNEKIFQLPKSGQKQFISYSEPISQLRQMLRTINDPQQAQVLRERIRFLNIVNREWRDGFELVRPNITFRDRLTLNLGDINLDLIDFDCGIETNHKAILVYIEEENILVDVGGKWLPNINENATFDTISRYIKILKELVDKEVRIVIPCHSDFASIEDLQAQYDYMTDMLDGITEARQEGLSLQQIKNQFSLEERYAHLSRLWSGSQPEKVAQKHENNIERIWNFPLQDD